LILDAFIRTTTNEKANAINALTNNFGFIGFKFLVLLLDWGLA
jgi:hypothetical protein